MTISSDLPSSSTGLSPTGSSSTGSSTSDTSSALARSGSSSGRGSALQTSHGSTTIADGVVQKISGIAAREVNGVYQLGGGAARAFGALRERIPGSSQSAGQGVSVEVGERQAAVDLDVIVEYGVAIADLAQSIRRNVIQAVEGMTGLDVTEVNVNVNDIHLPSDDDDQGQQNREPARVQ